MLQLILGRSGFGKTHTVLEAARDVVVGSADQTCYILVPEQASFETERAVLRLLGEKLAWRVNVISFTRMSETLMKQHSLPSLSEGAKIMLMSRAIAEIQDHLKEFTCIGRVDAVQSFLELTAECHQTGVTAALLQTAAADLPESSLRDKATELSLLLDAYESLSAQSGTDPQELLVRFAAFLDETRCLQGATVFVDGFKSFTAPEMQVLAAVAAQADSLTVTLCTDRLHDEFEGLDRFSVVMHTAKQLIRLAEDRGCQVAKPRILMTPHRFKNATLEVVEATAFTGETWETEESDAVRLTRCADVYEECGYVAQTIRRLMREQQYRARDIVVVARNLSDYTGVLDTALEDAAIPYYLDRRSPIATEGCVAALTAALSVAVNGWKTDMLMRLIKTDLLGFSVTSSAILENYIYIWNMTGMQFTSEWTQHPRGFQTTMTTADVRMLSRLNRLRRRLVRPLVTLSKALTTAVTGAEFAAAAYTYLQQARIDRMTAFQIARLRKNGETALAEHTEAVWNAMITLLDELATVLGNDRLSSAEVLDLLRAATTATDVGAIPQTLDAVQIGAADRIRFGSPRAVFVIGANEGVFPALPSASGILSERERRLLCEAGVPFEDHREQHTASEQFLAYAALSAASERLYISYRATLSDGSGGEPSAICHTVLSHLPYLEECPAYADDGSDVEYAEEAFERMASGFRAGTPLSKALYDVLYQDERYRGRLDMMTRIAEDRPIAFEDSAVAKNFFGDRMILSATRVEEYHKCRFMYFCHYGLKAQARRRAELNALESGNVMHYIMEHTLPAYVAEGVKSIDRARCFADAQAFSARFVQEELGGLENKPQRFVRTFERLQKVCGRFLWHAVEELSQSHFVPVDYELDISFDAQEKDAVKPMVLRLPDGGEIAMIGKVDRVDVYSDGTRRFVRVIDYKTGQKEFRLEDVVEGINLQMLIYMMTLCENGENRYGDGVLPAGMLYMSAKTSSVKVDGDVDPAKLELKKQKAMRMNGLLLDDEQVLQAMEPGVKGVFIPAELKADGSVYAQRSSVATLAQLGKLGRRAKDLLFDMAQSLRAGDVDACPYTTSPCAYCDYAAVCGHEADDRVREPRFDSAEAVLASFDETEES